VAQPPLEKKKENGWDLREFVPDLAELIFLVASKQ
jgi:hypothetical protein